jgi:2-desacetyl-2-hydroxyethyl bacteriochlorophyllide A dehydrogenase
MESRTVAFDPQGAVEVQPVLDLLELDLGEAAGLLLPVAGDEGKGGALLEERDGGRGLGPHRRELAEQQLAVAGGEIGRHDESTLCPVGPRVKRIAVTRNPTEAQQTRRSKGASDERYQSAASAAGPRHSSATATAGYAAMSPGGRLERWEFERRAPRANDVVIDVLYCGICHTDIHLVRNEWSLSTYPMVPGHEIVGRVVEAGADVGKWRVGDAVGVGCFVDSCRECPACREGDEQYCEKGATLTYNSLERDGKTPTYGGYSTRIVVDEDYVYRLPAAGALERTAPLLCAGITTYSPLARAEIRGGESVAIVGLGGLGHVAVRIAKAMGAEVTVISHSASKRDDAKRLGAADFIATSEPDAFAERRPVPLHPGHGLGAPRRQRAARPPAAERHAGDRRRAAAAGLHPAFTLIQNRRTSAAR